MNYANQLEAAAEAMGVAADSGRAVVPLFKRLCPNIYGQIVDDAKWPRLFAFWGKSVNIDENVGVTIVHPAIVRAIGTLAGVRMGSRIVHAGLEHTYGYLFSLIETPYGPKRNRWVTSDLENGFGLDPSMLGDRPRAGTLLANLTYFLSRILFRYEPRRLRPLKALAPRVAPELCAYDYDSLSVQRIVEQAVPPGRQSPLFLYTDLVAYPFPPADAAAARTLLIYSVQRGPHGPIRLITAFPVSPANLEKLRADVPHRGKANICLRYNAYVPELFDKTVVGRRYFAQSASQS